VLQDPAFKYHDCVLPYPPDTVQHLSRIWFIYGNGGSKHTNGNHKYIHRMIEGKRRDATEWRKSASREARKEVEKILSTLKQENKE
jgi:hypothetical protein